MTRFLLLAVLCCQPPEVRFSPHGGCTAEVVRRIDGAKCRVRVLAYSFTSEPIALALARAKARGVDVRVIVDSDQLHAPGNRIAELHAEGVPVKLDAFHAIAHNKVTLVDRDVILTGSFNYSAAAERSNAENLLTLHDCRLAALYLAEWSKHDGHSLPYPPEPP